MKYVALLRGIGPGNPNMRNDKLRAVFTSLGFSHVRSVISSGNILFESDETDIARLETDIERALQEQLGIPGKTIIRSLGELKELVARQPFGAQEHAAHSYQLVTFFKTPQPVTVQDSRIVALSSRDVCTSTDTTQEKTPNIMAWLERQFSKDITSRTFKTVQRIVAKQGEYNHNHEHYS